MYQVTNEDLALGAIVFLLIANFAMYWAWTDSMRRFRAFKKAHFSIKLDDDRWSLQRGPDGKIIFAIFKYPEIQEMERRKKLIEETDKYIKEDHKKL